MPLRVTLPQEQTLQIRFDVARQVYNAWLGEALRRMRLYRQSQAYHQARKIPRSQGKERAAAFAAARLAVGFTE